ncbi:hypothetical protein ACIBL3_44595 [Kribbella sp. NPDC050124]|uniref:hypothetical protein n=1 Tax=Kribbella sp. NPDC050124 TaxID=3364114 RepID=UPI0037915658
MTPRQRMAAICALAAGGLVTGAGTYLGLVTGAISLDLGIGRRTRPLGPIDVRIAAPREVVFDVVTAPYAERTTRAMQEKVRVLDRGTDMLLAAHYTSIRGRLRATTVETVRFTRPERVDFRLVRGPVPYVVESFDLEGDGGDTRLRYTGELGTDLWRLGQRWGDLVAARWEVAVKASLDAVTVESEWRHRSGTRP